MRYGRTDADAEAYNNGPDRTTGRVGAFGWMHGLLDHDMDYEAIGKVINVSRKVPISGRYEYMAQFRVRDQPVVRALVRTREAAMDEDGALDSLDQGVVTAYCKTGSQADEEDCPDWVNDTLG